MANSKVISFRLNDAEIQALEALQTESDDSSLNQTAARLLREILGTSTNLSTLSTGVNTVEALIEERLAAALNSEKLKEMLFEHTSGLGTGLDEVMVQMQAKLETLEQRLGELSA